MDVQQDPTKRRSVAASWWKMWEKCDVADKLRQDKFIKEWIMNIKAEDEVERASLSQLLFHKALSWEKGCVITIKMSCASTKQVK